MFKLKNYFKRIKFLHSQILFKRLDLKAQPSLTIGENLQSTLNQELYGVNYGNDNHTLINDRGKKGKII